MNVDMDLLSLSEQEDNRGRVRRGFILKKLK